MKKFKLGFLKSSTTSTDKSFLVDKTSKPSESCDGIPSPKSRRFFTLRRKRNNGSQSQPLFGQEARSASPPRAINPLVAATALAITSSTIITTSSSNNKQIAESLEQSPPSDIQRFRETGGQLLGEMTERVATIEDLNSKAKYNDIFQQSESLGRKQDKLDLNSEINQHDGLSYSRSPSSSIIASEIAGCPPLAPCIARQEKGEQPQIQFAGQRRSTISNFHHILEVLQRAARRVEADQSISQANIFRSLAPLAIFLYFIGIGVLLPRQQRYGFYSQTPKEEENSTRMILLFFVGMALTLVFLRGMVKLVSVFGKTFCEVDLTEIFRKGECVDVDGRGKGETELILGGLFM